MGLIGSGKTTVARALAATHDLIPFDATWHGAIQKDGDPPEDMARHVAAVVSKTRRLVVVDG